MKIRSFLPLALIVLLAACSSKKEEAQTALKHYTAFVDSIYQVNEEWKQKNDTDFVEMLMSDSSIRVDTIITLPKDKKTMVGEASGYHEGIMFQYMPLLKDVERTWGEMDEEMQNTLNASKKKFDGLLVE
jgi:major membrane immunogen (membrane-anchored lipoprotein)